VTTCEHVLTNTTYYVSRSDQGVTTTVGPPVGTELVEPALVVSFTQSAGTVAVGTPVTFGDASTTNGSAIEAWAWEFGDGETGSGPHVAHAYGARGSYTVTLTVTDTCGIAENIVVPNAVVVVPFRLQLPLVMNSKITNLYLPLVGRQF
jgi:PKD repeat protein